MYNFSGNVFTIEYCHKSWLSDIICMYDIVFTINLYALA